jgi:DNA-binding beta-propeller fold protein YncE
MASAVVALSAHANITATQVGGAYFHAGGGGVASSTSFNAEIAAYDALTSTLWVSGVSGVDVLNVTSSGLTFNSRIDTSAFGHINSIAIHNGIAAFALEGQGTNRQNAGFVQFYNTTTKTYAAGVHTVSVGALPDMLTFTANGSKLLVANEATPNTYGTGTDPVGGVSIIDMATRTVNNVALSSAVPTSGSGLRSGLPLNYEPEYIAVNSAGTQAYVTLQEHNGLAILDLNTQQFTGVVGLGLKDYSQPGNAIDATDRPTQTPAVVGFTTQNLKGAYQPDAIATYDVGGQTFLVMANEGDAQENDGDVARASSLGYLSGNAGRINVIKDMSSAGNLVTMGGRSFSIRDAAGNLVFDSGNILETEAHARGIYDDNRSDDKGVEPEGVTLRTIGGRTYAFIGLERTTKGAVAVFDITDPANANFVDMVVTNGTSRPEGLTTFLKDGQVYLAIANEGLGDAGATGMSTALYTLAPVPEPETWAMLLGGLGILGWTRRRKNQKIHQG